MLHSGKDLLKTSEDIAQKSREILHLDGIEVGGGGVIGASLYINQYVFSQRPFCTLVSKAVFKKNIISLFKHDNLTVSLMWS